MRWSIWKEEEEVESSENVRKNMIRAAPGGNKPHQRMYSNLHPGLHLE